MKNTNLFIMLLLTAVLASCIHFDKPYQRYGFDCDFNNNGKGLVLVDVDRKTESLRLKGNVTVDTGILDVFLKSPEGDTLYNQRFAVSPKVAIDTLIDARAGVWSLSYKSTEGNGKLYLYIDYTE